MENQHRQISGYRELAQAEINLMNQLKEKESETLNLIQEITALRLREMYLSQSQLTESARCAAVAKTNLQQGFMWAVRSVALPGVE